MAGDMKVLGEVGGMVLAASTGLLAVADSAAVTGGSIVAVLGFAGLLVRQIMKNQDAIWQIVAAKDREIESKERECIAKDRRIAYLEWEREKERYSYGDRATDPGPPPSREMP